MLWRMAVPVTVLRTHLHYTTWASTRLIEAASALTPDELTRDFQSADKDVLGTLAHVYAADRMWLGRIQGAPPAVFFDPAVDRQWPVVQQEWPALLARWQAWGDALQDASVAVAYHDLKATLTSPLADRAARRESRRPPPRSGVGDDAGDGAHAAAARSHPLLPRSGRLAPVRNTA
jgi:uncharacterized damage-inducible protein DinB